ncbi:glycosidase family 31 [Holotrichia oblita]|uniref:Glycosidase family 31 n=1 Tax=Holotrichia oblita TaxID=644536 RepID=A0ACB9TA89_HOLOL|nr:glycosidase family 31 [Holotrichia oblita]
MLSTLLVFAGLLLCIQAQSISMQKDEVSISVQYADNSLNLVFSHNEEQKLQAQIGLEANLENILECNGVDNCLQFDDIRLHITSNIENGFTILWTTTNTTLTFRDCFSLDSDNTNWFGGPERYDQYWPIEKLTLTNFPNVPHEDQWGAIVEPYWLNSKGAYIFVDERVPLFIDQNTNDTDDSVCFVAKIETPYPSSRSRILLNYTISAGANAREGHLHAVQHFLGKPSGHPANALIEKPIWSTWARYKTEINDALLIQFANEIIENGFSGQFEIDDYWETCYGSLTFRSPEFDDIDNTVQTIKNMGFTVALWTHPFVNIDCNYTQIGIDNDFFAKNEMGSILTSWWNSGTDEALLLDFTNAEAREWFVYRLQNLRNNHGFDTYKFDAGETSWAPQTPNLYGDVEKLPSSMTAEYVRACAIFGDYIEVRAGWGTQDLPVFVRMIDKDSRWGLNNGLRSLVTTLLQMNMNGYTMVLPDMVGGNGYEDERPSAEMFIRWLQANTFMPNIQFSYVPWDFDDDTVIELSRKFVELHAQYADEIIKAMEKSISDGYPVNPPVWWVDPTNSEALIQDTEYMLGEDILVAPVLEEGAVTRDIYLPSGTWEDGNTGEIYEGGQTLTDYEAPLEVLPYFIRYNSAESKPVILDKLQDIMSTVTCAVGIGSCSRSTSATQPELPVNTNGDGGEDATGAPDASIKHIAWVGSCQAGYRRDHAGTCRKT